MREITLGEYEKSSGLSLSSVERDTLHTGLPSVTIEARPRNRRDLSPDPRLRGGSHRDRRVVCGHRAEDRHREPAVHGLLRHRHGQVSTGRPLTFWKSMLCRTSWRWRWPLRPTGRSPHGLLHGYLVEEQALLTVRGRVRFAEQVGRRLDFPIPVELRYDEFTGDILPNPTGQGGSPPPGPAHACDRIGPAGTSAGSPACLPRFPSGNSRRPGCRKSLSTG